MSVVPLPSSDEPPRFRLLTPADLLARPAMRWLVHQVLPARGTAAIYGPSTAMKSFLYLDLVAHLAEAQAWFGYAVPRPVRVVVVILEGDAGFQTRVRGWEVANGRAFPESVRFVCAPFNLGSHDDRVALGFEIAKADGAEAVFIDTLHRATPGLDENSSRDAGLMLAAAEELQRLLFGGLVAFIAHTGKDLERGMRGHSSLYSGLDAGIEVQRPDPNALVAEWVARKVKDAATGVTHQFRGQVVDLGLDADGFSQSTLVVRPLERQSEHMQAVIDSNARRHADDVVRNGFTKLLGMGIAPVDGPTSPDYLPRQLVDKQLAEGHTKPQLADAMNRLMRDGIFVRKVIGSYSNRTPKMGLALA